MVRQIGLLSLICAGVFTAFGASAQPLDAYERDAQEAIRELRGEMMQHLQTEMKDKGPAEATRVCRHLAPEISNRIEADTGWEIRRTALRVRNPENAPTEAERGVLLSFETRAMAGQSMEAMDSVRLIERDGRRYVHYMRAIPTFEPCLVCHGEDIPQDVEAAIEKHYPNDRATGFQTGDLRGAFSLYKKYEPAQLRRAAKDEGREAAPKLPEKLSIGGGRYGSPRQGRDLFARHCAGCHKASDLVTTVYGEDAAPEANLCTFLETHGLTDAAKDCDIIAYMKALAATSD
ncbi:Tll0287-like domain-containing protein [Ferruginivarius sediminum]|uniref:DUF3365 domain-containing protein n=1 Tax=Ferruginivarius sediminum TaxID=2661937 RepID=A0A369TIF8_9PROT|nr:DUF3365 domain-containing protein [Ferruginivarius sediminum]RDD63917.1 DUF3365 domain-containing protein [Ferruginivarius sediminum]